MASAAHRKQKPLLAGKIHRLNDIGDAVAADDQRRTPVDHAIPNLARLLIAGISWTEQFATQTRPQGLHCAVVEPNRFTACGYRFLGYHLPSPLLTIKSLGSASLLR